MTHIYIGPDTHWGLNKGTPVRISKRRPNVHGLDVTRISDGKIFVVGERQVRTNRPPKRTTTQSGKARQKRGGRKK